jgi:hypothetical protein
MSLALVPLTAAAGMLVGALVHEATHAVLALALGKLHRIGWAGGLAGGPVVDYSVPGVFDRPRRGRGRGRRQRARRRRRRREQQHYPQLRSEVIRKGPLVLGLFALTTALISFKAVTLVWLFHTAFALGLLQASPQDLFTQEAEETALTSAAVRAPRPTDGD